jgi:hypothetical protein
MRRLGQEQVPQARRSRLRLEFLDHGVPARRQGLRLDVEAQAAGRPTFKCPEWPLMMVPS